MMTGVRSVNDNVQMIRKVFYKVRNTGRVVKRAYNIHIHARYIQYTNNTNNAVL